MKKDTNLSLIICGLITGAALVFAHWVTSGSTDLAGTVLIELLCVVIAGAAAGYFLKGKVAENYPVAIFASLFTYAVMGLFTAFTLLHYAVYVLAVMLASSVIFVLSSKYFGSNKLSKNNKLALLAVMLIPSLILSSVLGLYFTRIFIA